MPQLDHDSIKNLAGLGEYASLGIQLAATVAVFAGIGWYLDRTYDWTPWGLLIGSLFGAGGGMYSFIRSALRAGREMEAKSKGERKDSGSS